MGKPSDLVQGTLDLLILKTLAWGPMHGYAVARWISDTTDDDLQIEEGALYTALHRMEKRGWLGSEWGVSENNRKARFYSITRAGTRDGPSTFLSWSSEIQNKASCSTALGGRYSRIAPRGPEAPIPYFFLNLFMSAVRCLR